MYIVQCMVCLFVKYLQCFIVYAQMFTNVFSDVCIVIILSARIDLDIIYLNVYAHLILDIH